MSLNKLAKEIHENAVNHGWWEEERPFSEVVALCHSELSEALEEYRDKKPMYYVEKNCKETDENNCHMCVGCSNTKPEGIAVEMADCIIRILDWCGKENIDIQEVIRIKHEYNKTRPYKHGGKKI